MDFALSAWLSLGYTSEAPVCGWSQLRKQTNLNSDVFRIPRFVSFANAHLSETFMQKNALDRAINHCQQPVKCFHALKYPIQSFKYLPPFI